MHLGGEEPDVRATITTLLAIRDHPTHFSYGAIALAAGTAASILQNYPAPTAEDDDRTSQCEGQMSLHDVLDN